MAKDKSAKPNSAADGGSPAPASGEFAPQYGARHGFYVGLSRTP
jgi:hypothetical protein